MTEINKLVERLEASATYLQGYAEVLRKQFYGGGSPSGYQQVKVAQLNQAAAASALTAAQAKIEEMEAEFTTVSAEWKHRTAAAIAKLGKVEKERDEAQARIAGLEWYDRNSAEIFKALEAAEARIERLERVLEKVADTSFPLATGWIRDLARSVLIPDQEGDGRVASSPTTEERAEYVIRKEGFFYRPNANGYTSNRAEAGRWTEQEAARHRNDDPQSKVTVHHVSEFPPTTEERLRQALEEAEASIFALHHRGRLDLRSGTSIDLHNVFAKLHRALSPSQPEGDRS